MDYPIAPTDVGERDVQTLPAAFIIARLAVRVPFLPSTFFDAILSVGVVDDEERLRRGTERYRRIVSRHIAGFARHIQSVHRRILILQPILYHVSNINFNPTF